MTVWSSIFVIAVGAVLRYAVATQQWQGIRIHTLGLIIMVVGAVFLVLALLRAMVLAVRGALARRELARRRADRGPRREPERPLLTRRERQAR